MKPASHHITACKRCRALICWALTTANGRRQPIDATPDENGNLAVTSGVDGLLYVRSLTKSHPDPRPGEWQAMPHHATCAAAPPPRRSSDAQRRRSVVRPAPWQARP